MFSAIKEKRFAKRVAKRLLNSHSVVSAGNSGLADQALYKQVLLHAKYADPSSVDEIMRQAQDSVDLWTTSTLQGFGFRQIAHFVIMSEYRSAGNIGTVVSFLSLIHI